jgi:CheY-like chemotaxis protein
VRVGKGRLPGKDFRVILTQNEYFCPGFEVLERLRRDTQTSGIPVIIHTSKVLDPGERQALQHAISVISKDSRSREVLLEKFADAFRKAGVRFTLTAKEGQHV